VAKLAQTSIRYRRCEITERQFNELATKIDAAAAAVAEDIFGDGVVVDVVLEGGSLFMKASVIGALLLGTYHSVAEYKDFRESVELATHDAERFGSALYEKVRKLVGGKNADTVAIRKMTPGRISKVIDRLKRVERMQLLQPEYARHELEQIRHEISLIERDLGPEEQKMLEQQFTTLGLPPPLPADNEAAEMSPVAVEPERPKTKRKPSDRRSERSRPPLFRHHKRITVGRDAP
jgi:hypothetical protein